MSQQEPKKYGISLFGLKPREQEENKKRRDENIRTLNQAKALNDFPEKMDFEMKTKNPETGKYDMGGRRTRRRKSRKSKRSKKSRKSRKHRK
jgi:hypothetical protein